MMTDNRFDRLAAEWDQNPARRAISVAVFEAIRTTIVINKSMLVMDYGCGTGLLTFLLAGEAGGILAADTSDGMLEEVRKKISAQCVKNVRAMRFDVTAGHKGIGQFDMITSAMTMHHIDDVQAALRGLAAMLKTDGWLAVADLCSEDGSFHTDTKVAHNGFEAELLAAELRSIGLVDVSWRIVHEVDKNNRRYPIFLLRGRKG